MLERPGGPAAVFLVSLVAACAVAPPVVVTPVLVEPPRPPPSRARWVFPAPRRVVKAQMPLDRGARLYVGSEGLRRVSRDHEIASDAPTSTLDDFLGVMKDPAGQFLFVGVTGDVYPSADPLGPLGPKRAGPLGRASPASKACSPSEGEWCLPKLEGYAWVTTGKASIFGVTYDGRVLRSADFGATYVDVNPPRAGAGVGRPISIELDPDGNGLLLRHPQELFVTHDDGATFQPIATPGLGAREIHRDGDDHIWLTGVRGSARLDGRKLTVSTEAPVPLVREADETPSDASTQPGEKVLLCGERRVSIFEIAGADARNIGVTSAPLGDRAPKGVQHANLTGEGFSSLVACYGADLVYLRTNEEQEGAPRTSTVFRSHDWGATWTEDGQLYGTAPREAGDADVALGPDGWTYVNELCPGPSADDPECNHRQIRPAKASAFEDLAFTEEFTPTAFAFDRDRDRVYATGLRNGVLMLYESPLTQNHFARVKVIGTPSGAPRSSLTVDASGTVRVLMRDDNRRVWTLDKRPFGGEAQPTLFVPIGDGAAALVGSRGLILSELGDGWETADGGESWRRTSRAAVTNLRCGQSGCTTDDGVDRIGWDAPAVTEGDIVSATADPTTPPDDPPPPPLKKEPILDLVCHVAGASATVPAVPKSVFADGQSEARWATEHFDPNGRLGVLYGTKAGTRDVELFAPTPPSAKSSIQKTSVAVTTGYVVTRGGVVGARYHATFENGVRQPVDVELAWWSAKSGKVRRRDVKKIPNLVPSSGNAFVGAAQIVDGGLVYRPSPGREAYFVHDEGGAVETLPRWEGLGLEDLVRVGKTWIDVEAADGNASIFWLEDGAKAWTREDWTIASKGRLLLERLGAETVLGFGSAATGMDLLLEVPGVPTPDPSTPIAVRSALAKLEACPANAGFHDAVALPEAWQRIQARVDGPKGTAEAPLGRLRSTSHTIRFAQDGSACTAAEVVTGTDAKTHDSQTAFLYPEANGFSGYWFHRTPDPKDKAKRITSASLLSCEPRPPPAPPKH